MPKRCHLPSQPSAPCKQALNKCNRSGKIYQSDRPPLPADADIDLLSMRATIPAEFQIVVHPDHFLLEPLAPWEDDVHPSVAANKLYRFEKRVRLR